MLNRTVHGHTLLVFTEHCGQVLLRACHVLTLEQLSALHPRGWVQTLLPSIELRVQFPMASTTTWTGATRAQGIGLTPGKPSWCWWWSHSCWVGWVQVVLIFLWGLHQPATFTTPRWQAQLSKGSWGKLLLLQGWFININHFHFPLIDTA